MDKTYQPCFGIVGWIGSIHADNSLQEEINKQKAIISDTRRNYSLKL